MPTICARNCNSLWKKTKGLLGKDKPEAIYFETRWGIHTFGMQFSIDVIILDEQNRIVVLKKNLKPNRIFIWNPIYKKVLELPQGTVKQKNITPGKILHIKNNH